MAMTVNPDAGVSSPDTFREEGLYAFRFDLDNDAREELSFKLHDLTGNDVELRHGLKSGLHGRVPSSRLRYQKD